jgi:hypothetical protein
MRSSRVRRQAAKKPNKERTVQVRFSDEELAALDAICSEKKMTLSAVAWRRYRAGMLNRRTS